MLWQEENGEDGEGRQLDAQEERDDQEDDQEDDQAHGESKEQREADIDVRDQGHSENDARHENDDTKDDDNREEHVKSNYDIVCLRWTFVYHSFVVSDFDLRWSYPVYACQKMENLVEPSIV